MAEWMERLQAALAGRYTIERELGRGGAATVYLAHDLRHDRRVALKVLRPRLAATLGSERFLREISTAARLTHPHVLPLYDSGDADGILYYVMPWVAGESLRERLSREGALPVAETIRIARGAAAALAYAHAQGVVHRDIKPENILLEAGEAVIADFGIARALNVSVDDRLSLPGLAIGTPRYMSPEQSAGDDVDGRSDLYSLGCVLYEMLSGGPPFDGPTPQVIQARHRSMSPAPIGILRPNLPAGLQAVLDGTLAKLPGDRYQSAAELGRALDDLAGAVRTPTGVAAEGGPAGRRARRIAAAALLALGAIALDSGPWSAEAAVEPAPVLVADFDGPADDRTLRAAIQSLVTSELNQSSRIATVPRSQVTAALREAGLPDTAAVRGDTARQLAYRLSVKAVVEGAVHRVRPGDYALVVSAVDAESGRTLVTESGEAADSTVMAVVQRLVGRVRRELGDRRADIEADQPLWQAATPSFPAFRKYVDAVDLQMRGNLDGSNALLRDAVALDSGFATAWATLGMNYVTARSLDSARLAVSEALKRPERMNGAQLHRLRAEAAYALDYDLVGAVHNYDLYLQELPSSVGGRNNRGFYLSALGRYEDALADFRRAIELERFGDAHAQPQLLNAAIMLAEMGRLDSARAYYPRLAGNYAAYARLLDAAAAGDWAAAESTGAAVRTDPAVPGWVRMQATGTLASARAVRAGPEAAERTLDDAIRSATGPEARWYGQARLLLAAALRRTPGPLPASLRGDTSAGGVLLRARWLAARGDTAAAAALLDTLSRATALDRRILEHGPDVVRAQIALARGTPREAVQLLAAHAEAGEHDNAALDRPGTLAMRWLVADAWERLGESDSAGAIYAQILRPVRVPANQIALRGLVVPYAEARLRRFTRRGG